MPSSAVTTTVKVFDPIASAVPEVISNVAFEFEVWTTTVASVTSLETFIVDPARAS